MRKDAGRKSTMPVTGISSLLTIFAVLCLTVFAILSLSTANSDRILSEKMADSVKGYYEADCEAERILAQLRQGQVEDGVTAEPDSVYRYSCLVSETQRLEVRVRIAGFDDYEILRWQLVSSVDWEADESLTVWDGE